MILVDTSVWIDHFAGREGAHISALQTAIMQGEDLCVCGMVLTEVLQGIRADSEYRRVLGILSNLIYLPARRDMFIAAAGLYRALRKKGVTIRKPLDCMIAAICVEHSAFFLHNDRDFSYIAKHFPLQMYRGKEL